MLDYYGIITAIPRQWRTKNGEQGDTQGRIQGGGGAEQNPGIRLI